MPMAVKAHLLLNDPAYATVFKELLEQDSYDVTLHSSDSEFLTQINDIEIDILISSYILENFDGQSFLQIITSKKPDLPIIFISQMRDTALIEKVLEHPNSDVMIKPVVIEELKARIKFLINTLTNNNISLEEPIKLNDNIEINFGTKEVKVDGELVTLSPTEFKLLEFLINNKNKVVGVKAATVNLATGKATIFYDSSLVTDKDFEGAVSKVGYESILSEIQNTQSAENLRNKKNSKNLN